MVRSGLSLWTELGSTHRTPLSTVFRARMTVAAMHAEKPSTLKLGSKPLAITTPSTTGTSVPYTWRACSRRRLQQQSPLSARFMLPGEVSRSAPTRIAAGGSMGSRHEPSIVRLRCSA